MSKVTNKLASGVRKVKERQAAPVSRSRPPTPPAVRQAEPSSTTRCVEAEGFMHSNRVWPD